MTSARASAPRHSHHSHWPQVEHPAHLQPVAPMMFLRQRTYRNHVTRFLMTTSRLVGSTRSSVFSSGFYSMSPPSSASEVLLRSWGEIMQAFLSDFDIYASGFNFDKAREV